MNGASTSSKASPLNRDNSSLSRGFSTPPLQQQPNRTNSLQSLSRRTTPNTPNTPGLKTVDSFSTRNVSSALESTNDANDAWSNIMVGVLPLFNREGFRGYIEDLSALVKQHVTQTISVAQSLAKSNSRQSASAREVYSLATGLLVGDISELLLSGCMTLAGGLSNLSGDQLLFNLNEIWTFFFTSVLPSLEGIFAILRCDERVRIDIRRLALIGFRDYVIIPRIDYLSNLLQDLYTFQSSQSSSEQVSRAVTPALQPQSLPSTLSPMSVIPPLPPTTTNISSPLSDSTFSLAHSTSSSPIPIPILNSYSSPYSFNVSPLASTTRTTIGAANNQTENARRRQLISVLASTLTGDDRQSEIDSLLRMMRLGSTGAGDNRRALSRSWTEGGSHINRGVDVDEGVEVSRTPFSQDSFQFPPSET